jgi:hypothetical protein
VQAWEDALARVVVAGTAVAFAGIGLWALAAPSAALDAVGVAARDGGGLVELRAMYGGLQLGAAAFFGWCAADRARLGVGLVATATMIGGLGGVRTVGLLMDRPDGALLYSFAALEVAATAVAIGLLLRRSRG